MVDFALVADEAGPDGGRDLATGAPETQFHVAGLDDAPAVDPVNDARSAGTVNVTRAARPGSSATRV